MSFYIYKQKTLKSCEMRENMLELEQLRLELLPYKAKVAEMGNSL